MRKYSTTEAIAISELQYDGYSPTAAEDGFNENDLDGYQIHSYEDEDPTIYKLLAEIDKLQKLCIEKDKKIGRMAENLRKLTVQLKEKNDSQLLCSDGTLPKAA